MGGGTMVVTVADAEMARKILIDYQHFPKSVGFSNRWIKWLLGHDNLIFSNGHDWKRQVCVTL